MIIKIVGNWEWVKYTLLYYVSFFELNFLFVSYVVFIEPIYSNFRQ